MVAAAEDGKILPGRLGHRRARERHVWRDCTAHSVLEYTLEAAQLHREAETHFAAQTPQEKAGQAGRSGGGWHVNSSACPDDGPKH
jgi:hypothetical protein